MKKIFVSIVLINIFFVHAQNNYDIDKQTFYSNYNIEWDFFNGTLTETISDEKVVSHGALDTDKETVFSTSINKYTYKYYEQKPYYKLVIENEGKSEEYISLKLPNENNEFILLYSNKSDEPLKKGFFHPKSVINYYKNSKIEIDNYLEEKNIKYLPQNLNNISIGKPWVEGLEGSGIGIKIKIKNANNFSKIIISNGFVSRKTQTYYNNNRVKKIKINNLKKIDEPTIIELEDTANPQEFALNFSTNEIELEILAVYKGEKYDDTCINFIMCKK